MIRNSWPLPLRLSCTGHHGLDRGREIFGHYRLGQVGIEARDGGLFLVAHLAITRQRDQRNMSRGGIYAKAMRDR